MLYTEGVAQTEAFNEEDRKRIEGKRHSKIISTNSVLSWLIRCLDIFVGYNPGNG